MSDKFGHDFFDFGFSLTSIDELDALKERDQKIEAVSADASDLQNRLDKLYQAIQPLLNNLKKDTGKEYIYWPDRLSKIEAFEKHLARVYSGKS